MPIMDSLTSGPLYLQVKGILRSQKVKKYGVLYGKTPDGHPHLELYDSEEDYENFKQTKKKCDIKKIDLRNVKAINNQTQSSGKGKEYQMEIRTKKEKTVLLFDTEAKSREWNGYLTSLVDSSDKHDENSTSSLLDTTTTSNDDYDDNDSNDEDECVTVNEMYGGIGAVSRFEVTVKETELAQLCNITGRRTLIVSATNMAFENVTTKHIDCEFRMGWLRRFGKKETVFSFEVGRSCPNGPGEIKCQTDSAKHIHKLVSENSHSRGTTVVPKKNPGISAAQNNIKYVIEKQIEPLEPQDGRISGPALQLQKRHPGLGSGPKLIPLQVPNSNTEDSNSSPTSDRQSDKRLSTKSLDGERISGKRSGSARHGPVSEDFTKHLEHTFTDPQNKDKDLKKKEQDRKKEEKENKKKEEKREKERKKEEKKQKEKAKKDEEKAKKDEKKEKVQPATSTKQVGKSPGLYEEVDILDNTPSPASRPQISHVESHYSEPLKHEDLYDEASPSPQDNPVEYATPVKNRTPHVPCEYSDVKTVKGHAWRSLGREEDEVEHNENYSEIKNIRNQLQDGPPPVPGKSYNLEEEEEDDTYNRITLKSSNIKDKHKTRAVVETQNIYGTASAKEVGSLEVGEDDTYDSPQFDAYDSPSDLISSNRTVNSYEEANPKPKSAPQKIDESLYDEVS